MRKRLCKSLALCMLLLAVGFNSKSQTSTEQFETESNGSTSFSDNGVIFNIISNNGIFDIQAAYPGTGWNGTSADNRYIDNTGQGNQPNGASFSIKTTSNLFKVNRFWVYAAAANTSLNVAGTLTITGKLSGVTKFTQTKTTGFNTSIAVTNGYTLIDLTNLNGQNYSNIVIDELRITGGGNYTYLSFDAFTWVKSTSTITPTQASQAITFNTLSNRTYGDASFDLGASASSTLAVRYVSSNPAVASINDKTVTIHKAGTVTITAQQAGDNAYLPASDVSQTLTIDPKSLTITASKATKTYGETLTGASGSTAFTQAGLVGAETIGSVSIAYGTGAEATAAVDAYTEQVMPSAATGGTFNATNYNIIYAKGDIDVKPAALTITAKNARKTYGETLTGGTGSTAFTSTGLQNGETVGSVTIAYGPGAAADDPLGTYTNAVTPSAATGGTFAADNYIITYAEGNVIVAGASQTITFNTLADKTYGDAGFTLSATASSNLPVSYTSSDATIASVDGDKLSIHKAGTVTITAQQIGNTDYSEATEVQQTLKINPKDLTITAHKVTKTYGETLTEATGSTAFSPIGLVGSETIGSVTIAYGTGAAATAVAGTYTEHVTPSAATGGTFTAANYNITYAKSDLVVNKKAITVTAKAKDKTYGEIDPALSYDITTGALIGNDAFSGALTRDVGEDVGEYRITQGTLALNENYTLSYTPAQLSVGKKTIKVTAKAKNKTYGEVDPTLSYDITTGALVGNDAFSGALTRDAGENAEEYPITQGTLALSNNYTLSYTAAKLTILKKAITVTTNNQSKTYGAANPALTVTYSGLVNGETALNPAPNVTTAVTAATGTGSYDITASGTAVNYNVTYVKGTLTVTKAPLTITAENKEKIQGSAVPALTASYSGFVNGEDKSVLLSQPVLHTDVVAMTGQGEYPITVSGATAANYAIAHVPGIIKVNAGSPTGLSVITSTVYENAAAGALAGTLSSTSDDPTATFTYTFADGAGSADNAKFSIVGNEIRTNRALNFEEKAVYNVRVRTTAQNSLMSLEKELTITLSDVNEQPRLNDIAAQTICYTPAQQTVPLSGISAGEDANQTTNVTVSSSNSNLFKSLSATQASNGSAQVRYTVADKASGSAVVNIMVTDNGGTANGGVNTILKSFTLTVNALPVPSIVTNKRVTSISKGDVLILKAEGGSTYRWSNAPGILSGDNSQTLTVRPDATTTYRVLVTNASGCSETKEITIEVSEDFALLKGSNLISPNGDGVNDVFKIDNIDMYPNNEVKIFDRAGRLLYAKKGYSKDGEWTGSLNGAPLAEDTYYYVVDFGPNKPKIKGYVTIVRD